MVIDRAMYSGKNWMLSTIFRSVTAIPRTSTHVLLLSASLYMLLNRFGIDTAAFFFPEAGRAFLFVATLHCLKWHVFYRFHARQLKIISRQTCKLLGYRHPLSVTLCYFNQAAMKRGSNAFREIANHITSNCGS